MPAFKSADGTANETNAQLKDEELKVLMASSENLASLKPQFSDPVAFDQLVAAVNESTKKK